MRIQPLVVCATFAVQGHQGATVHLGQRKRDQETSHWKMACLCAGGGEFEAKAREVEEEA